MKTIIKIVNSICSKGLQHHLFGAHLDELYAKYVKHKRYQVVKQRQDITTIYDSSPQNKDLPENHKSEVLRALKSSVIT